MELETCIDQQDLKKFALGHLDEARSNAIAAHLSNCPQCEETMVGFDDTDDSMLAGVREAAAGDLSEAADSPAEAVLVCIPNPWGEPDDNRKPASTGEWVRDYELLEPLGRGGMGTVYKAVHTRLQRPVAIKLLPSRRLRDPDAVARFEREMRAIGRLDHPAIVRATDAGEADGTHFLVMDYVEGIDLSQLMKVTGPMDVASACEVIRQIAIALQYAHDQGLIHRDVKPSNLMVEAVVQERQGSFTCENAVLVKLLDLGLALFGAASEAVDELTTVGQLMGTLDYMAPEQADNSHNVDARADVYSLGATMFKLLTGTAPYETSQRRTPLQKMKALATIDAPSIRTRQPALQDDVVSIVDRMLVRDPASRFQTAAEVALAVTPFCRGHRLVELTHHAMQSSHHAPRDEPSARPADSKTPGRLKGLPAAAAALSLAEAVQKAAVGSSAMLPPWRLITRSVMATLGAIVIMAGILIRIQTDTGTLMIECASSDVPIEIRRGNDLVRQLTLRTGENKVTLHSGSYEIVLPAEYDSLTLDAGKFELSRGGEWVARISENQKPSEFKEVNQPLYAGKTFDEWRQVIQTERSQEELARALDAIGVLGHGEHDRAAAMAILEVMGRNEFVNPQGGHTVHESQVTVSAIRSMRGLKPDETVPAIADGFIARPPSVHEFVLSGLVFQGERANFPAENRISLGKMEPLATKLRENEQLANQMISLSELNSGAWDPGKYPSFSNNPNNSIGDSYIFDFIQAHVGTDKPSPEFEAYFRKFTIDPEQIQGGQRLYFAVEAATLLARHTPEPLHTRIFVHAIQDSLVASARSSRSGDSGGGFFPGNQRSAVEVQMPCWHGLKILGKHAEPALPYMFEILRHPPDEDSDFNALTIVSRWSADEASLYHHQANMRLFAIETIGLTQTQDPLALDVLRAELMRLIGQIPGDGPFELTPGRHATLISPAVGSPIAHTNPPPQDKSPIHIELANSSLLAWKALTGNYPRFASTSLGPLATATGTIGVEIATSKANLPEFVSQESVEK